MDYALEFQEVAILRSFLVTKHHGGLQNPVADSSY